MTIHPHLVVGSRAADTPPQPGRTVVIGPCSTCREPTVWSIDAVLAAVEPRAFACAPCAENEAQAVLCPRCSTEAPCCSLSLRGACVGGCDEHGWHALEGPDDECDEFDLGFDDDELDGFQEEDDEWTCPECHEPESLGHESWCGIGGRATAEYFNQLEKEGAL